MITTFFISFVKRFSTFLVLLLVSPLALVAQNENEANAHQRIDKKLEVELELYPFNVLDFSEEVVKVEVMFDYHDYIGKNKNQMIGVRYFNDVNVHTGHRDMTDLIWYTEMYTGFKHWLQFGGEIGSVSGQEYLSLGPEYVDYNNVLFKRIAINTRIFPDRVLGYEYTSQEFDIGKLTLSSTGTGRIIFPSNKQVVQFAFWMSHHRFDHIFFGGEYEYNNSRVEKPNELFFGLKFELN